MKSVRLSFLDVLRGFLISIMLYGHTQRIFNPGYPSIYMEGFGGSFIPWNSEIFGYIRLCMHGAAFGFFILSGWTFEKHLIQRSNWDIVRRGLILLFLEFTIFSYGWSIREGFGFNHFNFILEALGLHGACLIFQPLFRNLKGQWIITVALLLMVSPFLRFVSPVNDTIPSWLSILTYSSGPLPQFLIIYSLAPWLGVYLLGRALAQASEGFLKKYSIDKIHQMIFLGSISFIGLFLALEILGAGWRSRPLFQLGYYPPSLNYIVLSIGWLGTVYLLTRFVLMKWSFIRSLFSFVGRFGRSIYSSHALVLNVFLLFIPFLNEWRGFFLGLIIWILLLSGLWMVFQFGRFKSDYK